MTRFTVRGIAALKPKAERYEAWEDGRTGLGLRISPKGRKSWIFLYRFDGRARRLTMGTYPAVTLADARVEWGRAKKMLERGEDPGTARIAQNVAERNAETVSDLIAEYLERHARFKRSGAADERMLRRNVEPLWGRRKATSITRRDVIYLLDRVADRGTPVLRNRLLSAIQKMFVVGMDRGLVETTPCVGMSRLPEKPRERALTPDEVKALWIGLGDPDVKMQPITRLALKFLLATGQRRQEVTGTLRSEISTDDAIWEIPSDRTKAGRTHRIPLSPLALSLIEEIDRLRAHDEDAKPSPWLFPSPHSDRAVAPPSITNALRANLSVMGLEGITPHDFRRTASTVMAELGVSQFIIGRVLNHSDHTTTGRVYNKFEYMPEKAHALGAWAARIEEIVSGKTAADNVVRLSPAS